MKRIYTDYIPSPREVAELMTKKSGWTGEVLDKWGVPWPPPKGWREALGQTWKEMQAEK